VGEDWPISYWYLKQHYERLELAVSDDYWPSGDRHRYPHTPHPIAGGAEIARGGARRATGGQPSHYQSSAGRACGRRLH